MSFADIQDIKRTLNAEKVSVRNLYNAYAQRLPVAAATKDDLKRVKPDDAKTQIPWLQKDSSLATRFIQRAMEKEEFDLVCDVADEMARHLSSSSAEAAPVDPTALAHLRMAHAWALTRLGYTRDARGKLEPFVADDAAKPLKDDLQAELLKKIGDILQEESQHAASKAEGTQTARQALEYYQRSLALDPSRVDVLALTAAASFVLSEPGQDLRKKSETLARRLLDMIKQDEDAGIRDRNDLRFRAVAQAVLGDAKGAVESYKAFAAAPDTTVSELATARYYARLLAETLGQADVFDPAFPPLQLVVFSGHMIDRPDSTTQRFPPEMADVVRPLIRNKLNELKARVGFTSAGAGADLIFAEELQKRGGLVHVVLPWSLDEFRKSSVAPYNAPNAPGGPTFWQDMFDRVIRDAASVRELGQTYSPASDVGWEFAVEVTAGLALRTARVARLDLKPMVLWDRKAGWGPGGTESFEVFWREHMKIPPVVVPLPETSITEARTPSTARLRCEQPTLGYEVKTMLFADVVGYSKLREQVYPDFVRIVMERLSQLAASSKHAPYSVNTWGDAIYAVFDYARDAGMFALELTRMIRDGEADWLGKGLFVEDVSTGTVVKKPLNVRVGLHTGPVMMHFDPVVRRLGFSGSHVNRAARIEPVTDPGEVFASEEFAALIELNRYMSRNAGGSDAPGIVCEYVGSKPLAKGYPGLHRIYRVLPKRAFGIEELAKAIHADYCEVERKKGNTVQTNPSMAPWDQLPPETRNANAAQAADIPNKLRFLGYELAPHHGIRASEVTTTAEQLEALSKREHERWMRERQQQGWSFGKPRDNVLKLHPSMVPWDQLGEEEKEKDRNAVRNVPRLVELSGFRVRKIR